MDTFKVGNETVAITCSLGPQSDITGSGPSPSPYLSSYRSGDYSGDGLDNLYNIGGTGTKNQLVAGLVTQGGRTVQFNFACSATLNGTPLPIPGLVMADAESTNGTGEFISASIPAAATWHVIDRYRDTAPACASNSVLASQTTDGTSNTLRIASTGECGTGSPMAVAFMDGTSSASNVTVKGGGKEAIALGVFVAFDHGDAPASYGDAAAAENYPFLGGTLPTNGTQVRVSDPGFTLATVGQPTTRLGAIVDPEAAAQYSQNADGDDLNVGALYGNANDEDAISPPGTATQLPGSTYTLPNVACTGPGQVAGWIDWNHDGMFEPGERSGAVECTGTTVSLTWVVPSDVVSATGSAHSFLRLRIGPDGSLASPTGATLAGEVEDYSLNIVVPVTISDNDSATTAFATPVTVNPLTNDTPAPGTTLDPSSVRLLDGAGNPVTTLITAAGTYTVDASTGAITFVPAAGFRGPAPAVSYNVTDSLGRTSTATIAITVKDPALPTPLPDTTSTPQGTPVTLNPAANDVPGPTGAAIVADSVRLIDPGTGAPISTLTVAGQGTYTVDTATGAVTFTPLPTFTGLATPIAYQVTDANGATATSSITATVIPVNPLATPDETTTPSGVPVTLDVVTNDRAGAPSVPLVPGSVVLIDPSTGLPVTTLVVPGQGTYTVDPATGTVTFTSLPTFTGPVTPITYRVSDANGSTTTSSISITVQSGPEAVPDTATTVQNTPVTVSPLSNDIPGQDGAQLDPSTLTLIDPATGLPGTTVAAPGVGTYTIGANATVTFTPAPGFTGQAPPLTYTALDTYGLPASSTVQVTVTAAPLVATPNIATTGQDRPVTITPAADDLPGASGAGIIANATRLLDASGTPVTSLAVAGQGTYTVDTATGAITFTPLPTFTGVGLPVRYRVTDANGTTADATITPNITPAPVANPDTATTAAGTPVTTNVLANDTAGASSTPLDPSSLRLIAPGGALVTALDTAAGHYTANADGTITFTPAPGFTGAAPAVAYLIADTLGVTSTSSYTVTVTPAASGGTSSSTTTVEPLANTGADARDLGLLGVLTLVMGILLLGAARRRARYDQGR